MLVELIEKLEQQKPLSKDAYRRWRTNGVTKRLMEELELKLIDALTTDAIWDSSENMARGAVVRQTTKENVEAVLNWKPEELVDED